MHLPLTTTWSFFFETVIVFVEAMVDVVLVTFDDDFFDSTTGTDIFNAVEYNGEKTKWMFKFVFFNQLHLSSIEQ